MDRTGGRPPRPCNNKRRRSCQERQLLLEEVERLRYAPAFTATPAVVENYDSFRKKRRITLTVENVQAHCASLNPLQYKVPERSYSTNRVIRNLNALTDYNITIRATNNEGLNSKYYISVRTGELEPWSVPVITDKYSENMTCVIIEWDEPLQPNGVITKYEHKCAKTGESHPDWTSTTKNSLTECTYESGDRVNCSLRAATKIGPGPTEEIIVHVTCDKPSPPVFSLSSNGTFDDTVTINIYLEESKHKCQYIQSYSITITEAKEHLFFSVSNASAGSILVPGALPFTNYSVSITATNNANMSSKTERFIITAETKAPEVPITMLVSNASCVTVNLYKPEIPNGVIQSYTVSCTHSESIIINVELKADMDETAKISLCGIPSATLVRCSTSATNSIGQGMVSENRVYSQLTVTNSQGSNMELIKGASKGISLKVKIKKISIERGTIGSYLVMLTKQPKGRRKRDTGNCGCTKESAGDRYKESAECYCYTTAELSAKQIRDKYIFLIGDEKNYGEFNNGELEKEAEYLIYIAVKVETEEGLDPLIELHPDYITAIAPKGDRSGGVIAGAVVGGLALAALVIILLYILWRIRNKSLEKTDRTMEFLTEVIDTGSENHANRTREVTARLSAQFEETTYGNMEELKPNSEAIPVHKLGWYTKTNKSAIRDQYDTLKRQASPKMDVALEPQNKGKCRYKNLYPADDHRVKLCGIPKGKSDFINASFLKGYSRDNQYIAAQGPFTNETVADFWLMIWEQRPSAIVMVTRAIENTKKKCMQYWPLEVGVAKVFGEFYVSRKSLNLYAEFSMSHLEVAKNGEKRTITHFNYLSWPDHGVPDIEMFVSFHRLISSRISNSETQPLLVHCSAGVGRTGTYVALDYLLDQAAAEGSVDAFECLSEMRTRRPCMIQTVEQYELLHDALYESLSTARFNCQPTDIEAKMAKHVEQPGSDVDLISAEFKHAKERTGSVEHSFLPGKDPANHDKNRFHEILPSESSMPFLTDGANGNYINAVFVDGYRDKKEWIATQLPLANTLADFWQLIIEKDTSIIVQLEPSPIAFYPMKDSTSLEINDFVIRRENTTEGSAANLVDLYLKTKQTRMQVRVIILNERSSESLPTPDAIISLQETTARVQQEMMCKTMCATCLDGSTKCGLFICAHNAIEQLKTEQLVDVYTPTVMAQLRRPQFISAIDQYEFLYRVLIDYLQAFGEYEDLQTSGDFADWQEKIELIAKIQKIDDLTAFLPLFLNEPAFAAYKQLGYETKNDYAKLKPVLLQAFGVNCYAVYDQPQRRVLQEEELNLAYQNPAMQSSPIQMYVYLVMDLTMLAGQSMERQMTSLSQCSPTEPWSKPINIETYSANASCAVGEWKEPIQPNGTIINYEVSCHYLESQELTVEDAEEKDGSGIATFCQIPSATLITCISTATNSVGYGREATIQGYNQFLSELTAGDVGEELIFTIRNGETYGFLNAELEAGSDYIVNLAVKAKTVVGILKVNPRPCISTRKKFDFLFLMYATRWFGN
ncbi:receptor-type tyrosine-protein phosphatase kappa-like [Watersipora subatra]|uniref:receptor-type tyrosine-protein phosphatase kappa-like n=1 Tax=Watersipora subatra TaxID=2589382 RepID=UPI00355C896A